MKLSPAQRLIVPADFRPDPSQGQGLDWVNDRVLDLAKELEGTGVCIKLNSAARACGYGLLIKVSEYGLEAFADIKADDISETLGTDGVLLNIAKPKLMTAKCSAGINGLKAIKAELPHTEVLGVTVLTSLTAEDVDMMQACSIEEAVLRYARIAKAAGIDGLIASAAEIPILRKEIGDDMSINTPAIRPAWFHDEKDDQNPGRIMTPEKAIKIGATRLVIGRPILRAKNRRDAVLRTIEEIALAA